MENKYVLVKAIENWAHKKIEERGGLNGTSPLSRAGEMVLLGELLGFLDKYSEKALTKKTKEQILSGLYAEMAIRATPKPDELLRGYFRGIEKAIQIVERDS